MSVAMLELCPRMPVSEAYPVVILVLACGLAPSNQG